MTRADAAPKIRGGVEYGADLSAPKMLWGALVPAPIAHGRITRLDLRPARSVPGVVAAIGAADLAALLPQGGGDPERPLFPKEVVTYLGQPIAAVAAETLEAAQWAVRETVVESEAAPIVGELDDIFPDFPGPEAANSPHVTAHVHARHGDVETAFREADLVHSETYRTSGVLQVALEPHACLAEVVGGSYTVRSSTQSPFGVREDAAQLLGIPEASLRVSGTWVGGGFGGKGAAFLEPYALLLASATGRPVKLALSYPEEFRLGRSTLPAVVRLDTAVVGQKVSARRARLLLDTGASLPGRDFATGYAISFLLGPYRVETFELEGYAVRTNKPPFGPHRAPFAPQCAFVAESHIDGLARRLGEDPVAFRVKLAWGDGASTPLGQPVRSFGLRPALQRARAIVAEWRRELKTGSGIGIGCGFWSTGTGAGGEARLRLTRSELVVEEVEWDIGSGSVTRGLVAVAERATGLPAEAIRVEPRDTDSAPFDSGVFGSRTVGALGQAVVRACEGLLKDLGERWPGQGALTLRRKAGRIHAVRGRRSTPVERLFTAEERKAGGLAVLGKHYGAPGRIDESRVRAGGFYPYHDFTATVAVAQADVDRETGQVQVARIASILDVGRALDPEMLRAQVEGAVAMGLGTALTEETMWGPDGRLLNPNLLDYRVPALGEIPPIQVELVEGQAGAGPFGAKGAGEPPIIPVPAAVANAVSDATGARVFELPLTPERVARALKLL